MERRPNRLKGNIGLFILFLLIGVCCQTRFALTDTIRMNLYPIPLMIAIYLGYKLGRTAGLIAGLACSWFWTIVFVCSGNRFSWAQLVFDGVALADEGLSVIGYSLQHGIIIGLLGWTSAYLFDRLDEALKKKSSSINALFPLQRCSFLVRIFKFFDRPYSPGSVEAKSDHGETVFKREWLHKTAIVPTALILALLNVHLKVDFPLRTDFVSIYILPLHISSVGILIYAFYMGSGSGVRLTLAVWLITLFLMINFVLAFDGAGNGLPREVRPIFSILTPAQVVGMAILAWWAGKIGELAKNPDRFKVFSSLWEPLRRNTLTEAEPGYGMLFLLLILIMEFQFMSRFMAMSCNPLIIMILTIAIWSLRHDGAAISNRIMVILVLLGSCSLSLHLSGNISLDALHVDMFDVVVLGLIPLVIAHLDFKARSHWRMAVFGILIALVIPDIYVRGGYIPLVPVIDIFVYKHKLVLITWALTLVAFEAATRILHYYAARHFT